MLLYVPPILLTGWALIYMAEIFEFATAPGIAVNFEYETEKGKVNVSTESYSFDPGTKTLRAKGVRVIGPDGRPALAAKELKVVWDERSNMTLTAREADAFVDRLPNGDMSFFALMPKPSESQGPEQPLDIFVESSRMIYRDLTGASQLKLNASTNSFRITGAGTSWLVNGTLNVADVGSIPIQLVSGAENATQTTLTLRDTKLIPIINHLVRWVPDASELPIRAKSLVGSGVLVIDASPKQALKIHGSLKGAAKSLAMTGLRDTDALYDLRFSGERGDGKIVAKAPGISADAKIAMSWPEEFRLIAGVTANVPSAKALPREWVKDIPKDLDLRQAVWTGLVGFSGNTWAAEGKIKANLSWAKERFGMTEATFIADDRQLVLQPDRLTWNGTRLLGAAKIDLKSNSITAFVQSPTGNLTPLLRKFGVAATANGRFVAQITGKTSQPKVLLGAEGTGIYRLESGKNFAGKFEFVGSGDTRSLKIGRALIKGKDGTLVASGDVAFAKSTLNLEVVGAGLSPQLFAEDLTGRAYLKGTLKGTASNPVFDSAVDLYGTQVGEAIIPLVTLEAKGNLAKVELKDIAGNTGFSQLAGNVSLNLKNRTLSGTFNAPQIQLADFADTGAAGRLKVENGLISGTFDQPVVSASFTGGPLAVQGLTLDEVSGKFRSKGDLVALDAGRALVKHAGESGQVNLNGSFALSSGSGNLFADWTNLPISPVSQFDARYALAGQGTGTAKLTFSNRKLLDGAIESSFNNLVLNSQSIGTGALSFTGKNGNWKGSGGIGTIDNYVSIEQLNVGKDGSADGVISALNLRSETLERIATPLLKDNDPEMLNSLRKLSASLSTNLAFNYDGKELNFSRFDTEFDEIRYSGREAGKIVTKLTKNQGTWNVSDLRWELDSQSLVGKGIYKDSGDINASFALNKFDLTLLNVFDSKLPLLPGSLDANIELGNTLDNPALDGSARIVADGTDADRPTLDIFQMSLRDKQISAFGQFRASGFTGTTTLTGPSSALMAAKGERPATDRLTLNATLSPRNIREFSDLIENVDLDRSFGTIGGSLVATGNIDLYTFGGEIRLMPELTKPDQIVFKNTNTYLKSPRLGVRFEGEDIVVEGSADSSEGGSAAFFARTPFRIPERNELKTTLKSFPLTGQFALGNFRVAEGDLKKGNRIEGALRTLSGNNLPYLAIGGTLYEPEIVGTIYSQGLNFDLPTFGPTVAGAEPPINPKFNIQAYSTDAVTVRTTNANLVANATGSLNGSLLRPEVSGALIIKDGFLRLPNARINLEEGGTVNLTYKGRGELDAILEAPVNLIGRTSLSAKRGVSSYERYDITMFVRGDMIKEGGLIIDAQSDPPDLTSNEIMAIIGQRDLIESFAGYGTTGNNQQLRNAVLGLVVPSFSDWLTNPLAQTFSLDYLALDYNGIEGTTIFGAKSLNRYLTLQGRRGIGPTTPFSKSIFELKLIYRIPSRNINLSRARFSLGTDQDRPWRITVEYSFKL